MYPPQSVVSDVEGERSGKNLIFIYLFVSIYIFRNEEITKSQGTTQKKAQKKI